MVCFRLLILEVKLIIKITSTVQHGVKPLTDMLLVVAGVKIEDFVGATTINETKICIENKG